MARRADRGLLARAGETTAREAAAEPVHARAGGAWAGAARRLPRGPDKTLATALRR